MILPTDIAANELLLINSRSPSAETGSFIRLFPLLLVFSSRKCRNCAPVCERGRQIEKEREIERERESARARVNAGDGRIVSKEVGKEERRVRRTP